MIDRVCGVRASLSIVSVPPLVEPVLALSDGERGRTARIASLAGSDELGQRRLAGANVAIVGAGGAVFGIGSDIGGSVRIPAAFCGTVGHKPSGGLISTAWDYAIFCQMYLNGGVYGGKRILKPETIAQMMTNQLPEGQWIRFATLGELPGKVHGLAGGLAGAGLGWLGKHSNVITRDLGSWVFIGELILDLGPHARLIRRLRTHRTGKRGNYQKR